jgi:hypothetical protein
MIGHSGLISNRGDKDFFFTVSIPNMDPIQTLRVCNGALFQSSGAVQLTPIPWNVEVQNASINNCTSAHVFTEWCLIKHRQHFTFHGLFNVDFVPVQAVRKVYRASYIFSQSPFPPGTFTERYVEMTLGSFLRAFKFKVHLSLNRPTTYNVRLCKLLQRTQSYFRPPLT